MLVVATSDTHGQLPDIPVCDLLIVAGDVCPTYNHEPNYQRTFLLKKFIPWLISCPALHVVWTPGNHDFALDDDSLLQHELSFLANGEPKIHLLIDSGVNLHGYNIWGTPWTSSLPGWAFQAEESTAFSKFQAMPSNLDILVTHGPPKGISDRVSRTHVGSIELREVCEKKRPKNIICGHIHEGFGGYRTPWGYLYNVSHNDENYQPAHKPVELVL